MARKIPENTKWFNFYQPNSEDPNRNVGDCQIRALSKALSLTWLETFDRIVPICRKQQVMTIFSCDLKKTKEAMKELGFEYHSFPNKKGVKKPTVEQFCKTHKEGTYILSVRHHVTCCVNGICYDTWNPRNKHLSSYYELTK